ncbi:type I DNA topoisomerase [Leptolyngbya sp. AN03gr2]|uniref:type I DNA topoisomerase n=1 Tax=unclassified Leptolyngbya TaxID=2650499 RepID=UPI003D322846
MSKQLLIVESRGKLGKLRQILGPNWIVKASVGHIRELAKDGENALGFEFKDDKVTYRFIPRGDRGKEVIEQLKAAAKQADRIFLATDPDREGEVISWHIQQALNLRNPDRVVYSEITAAAVQQAIANPRKIDQNLVFAGLCRSILDKLVGFTGSPVLWNIGASSMGRVQSWALHTICERERQIQSFRPKDYWSVFVDYEEGFRAFFRKAPSQTDNDPTVIDDSTDRSTEPPSVESDRVTSETEAEQIVAQARQHPHRITKIEGKIVHRVPPPPFITSSLQQAAGSKLKWAPEDTMKIAQELFEQGFITYHRTDSTTVSQDFQAAARQWLEKNDPANIPTQTNQHRKPKGAQEAHEAIRPTNICQSSGELRRILSAEQFDLYLLIWKRAIASQCNAAKLKQTRVLTQSGEILWEANGQLVEFTGFLRYWNNLQEKPDLPQLSSNQSLTLQQANHSKKQTKSASRFTEPTLIQRMEIEGIGRPSTYAYTIERIKHWKYAERIKTHLHPTELGMQTDAFLQKAFPELLEASFTSGMEISLDQIANGDENWETWLTRWHQNYWEPALNKSQSLVKLHQEAHSASPQNPSTIQKNRARSRTKCPSCQTAMVKIPSQKVEKGFFLRCEKCEDSVLFWDESRKEWTPPRSKSATSQTAKPESTQKTEVRCPVCQSFLEIYEYQKDKQTKHLLRCSDAIKRKQPDHQTAVFFRTANGWWSPQHGTLDDSTCQPPPNLAPK